ncbi:BRO-N domain-containing protein [Pseudomonas panipatensis]|uniref:Prophage antirepressor n=1 Tax=Pseudomonas panipatensis TaxID=428992 RepID=A0A1G8JDD0_9PSED|nr:Bro-N domain-containing protein [Pseudomonas panipatensis]SDI29093.1 Prophage antirepressor [Pseudomonas panipatensis]SMP50969.1 Prophage antirepressor [Pseudomonas panipatensis]
MTPSLSSPADSGLIPSVFVRHHRQLRALLIERQAWFVGRDLARLTNSRITTRVIHKLDADQCRTGRLLGTRGACEEELLISESGVYTLLMVHFYHPENRSLRQWLSNEVVPVLRDAQQSNPHLPRRRLEQVQGQEMSLLDWQGTLWVRFGDAVRLMEAGS